jgi:CRP/FNR family cyclic AMP-dependent transcriptional regulator
VIRTARAAPRFDITGLEGLRERNGHACKSSRPRPGRDDRIGARAQLRKARGEFIYMPGDRADFVYILKGQIKLSVLSESGKEIAIDIIQPGEIFGEFALVDESPRSNMAQALDDVLMWVFTSATSLNSSRAQPKLALSYIRLVGDRRRRMEKKLSDITAKAVSARVCELLHEISTTGPEVESTTTSSRSHITTSPA